MNKFKLITLLLGSALLISCSTTNDRYQVKDDYTPSNIPPLSHIENVIPHYEPYSRGGNRDYTVRNIHYKVLKGVTDFTETGYASWYGNKFHGHLTSNGERYNMFAMSAAHKNLPLPSYIQVTNLENNKQIIVRVNDRGPFHEGRIVDLSYAAAAKLDILRLGTAKIKIKLLHYPDPKTLQATANTTNADKTSNAIVKKNIKPTTALITKVYYVQYLVTSQPEKAQKLNTELGNKYNMKSSYLEENNHYKLRLGPFSTQLNAQKNLIEIRKEYPKAFIVPN